MSATVTMSLEEYNKLQNELSNLRATHEDLYMRVDHVNFDVRYYRVLNKEEFVKELEEANEKLCDEIRTLKIDSRSKDFRIASLENEIKNIMKRKLWDRIKNKEID